MYGGERQAGTAYCLGHPAHLLQEGEVLCPFCGTLAAGFTLDTYQVQSLLGKGRSGASYLASHLRTRQMATLKVFPPDALTQPLWEDARRELRLLGTFRQVGGILPVFRCGPWLHENSDGRRTALHSTYLLTLCQYTRWSLPQFLTDVVRTMPPTSILSWITSLIEQIGMTLSFVHEHGVYHGALVPGNILLSEDRCWVADFSLARLHPPAPPYLAPELTTLVARCLQQQNIEAFWKTRSPQSDQYSLAVLYQYILFPLLPAELAALIAPILHQGMHANPLRRFASVQLFTDELLHRLQRSSSFTAPSGPLSTPPQKPSVPSSSPPRPPLPSPEATDDWETLADRYFAEHNYEAALHVYQNILKLQPTNATFWASLGDTHFALQEYEKALHAYDTAIKYNPKDGGVWFNRGTALDALGRHADAQTSYDRASFLQGE